MVKTRWKKGVFSALVCYWMALFIGTHIPHPPEIIFELGASDKWLHLSAYAGLAFLFSLYGALRRAWTWRTALAMVALLALFGALDEVTQIPVGRECEFYDWVADVTGSALGGALFLMLSALVRHPPWSRRDE